MLRFSTDVALGDHVIRVEGDDFREFHDAVARLVELDRESALLYEAGAERVLAERHKDRDGNEYWGLCDASDPRHTVTFGQFREGTAVSLPFFPKSDGHYVPEGYVPVRSLHADAERQRDEVVGLPPEGEPIALLSEAEVEQVAGVLRRQGWTRAEVHRLLTSRYGLAGERVDLAAVPAHQFTALVRDAEDVALHGEIRFHLQRRAA